MSTIDLSVIIVSYNAVQFLRACLKSVYARVTLHSFEVIVVDNASTEENVRLVRNEFPDVRLIENPENAGYARAVNRGFEAAKGEFCAVMNADTELISDVFPRMLEFYKSRENTGIVGCMLRFPDGSSQRSYFRFPSLLGRLAYFTGLNRLVNAELFQSRMQGNESENAIEVDVVCGAFFVLKRSIFQSVGGFDPDFFLYHEESDICCRLHKAGFRNAILADCVAVHHGSHDETPDNFVVYFHRNRSLLIYFYKNRSRFSLWLLMKMNIFFLMLKTLYTMIPVGDVIRRNQRRLSHRTVLRYHFKFIAFLLNRQKSMFP